MKNTIDKYKGLTFAEVADKLSKKYKNKEVDLTEKAAYEAELDVLIKHQDNVRMAKQMEDSLKEFKHGGTLPKYPNGTPQSGLANIALMLNQGLEGGQNLSQGLIGMNTDYQSSNYLTPTPDLLKQTSSIPTPSLKTRVVEPTKPAVPLVEDPWNGVNPNLPFIENPFQGMINELPPAPTLSPEYAPERLWQKPSVPVPNLQTRVVEPTKPLFGVTPPTINNSLGMSTPKDAPATPREMSAYTPALIGQGISTAINAGILSKGYDKVAPVDNPFESQVINNMASRGIDTTQQRNQILAAYNAAKEGLGNVRSANVQQALGTNLMNVTQDNLAESKLNEQQANLGFKADYANVLNNLGQQKVGARTYAEQLNTDAKSNWQGGVSELGKHLADMGLSQTTLKLNNVQQTAIANIMSQKYPDFMIGEAALKSYLNGTYTNEEFVKLKEAATKNPELQSILDFATFQKQQKENTK